MLRYATAQVARLLCRTIAPIQAAQAQTLKPSRNHFPSSISMMTIRTCKKKSGKDKGKDNDEDCDEEEEDKKEKKAKGKKSDKAADKCDDGKKDKDAEEVHGPHGVPTGEAEIIAYFVAYFDRCDIDPWELRQGMNTLLGMDLIVDPPIINAALHACRRQNDIALAIRWLEGCKEKCGGDMKVAYPYIMKAIKPTLQELGVPTLEELHYDEPELALESVYDM